MMMVQLVIFNLSWGFDGKRRLMGSVIGVWQVLLRRVVSYPRPLLTAGALLITLTSGK